MYVLRHRLRLNFISVAISQFEQETEDLCAFWACKEHDNRSCDIFPVLLCVGRWIYEDTGGGGSSLFRKRQTQDE